MKQLDAEGDAKERARTGEEQKLLRAVQSLEQLKSVLESRSDPQSLPEFPDLVKKSFPRYPERKEFWGAFLATRLELIESKVAQLAQKLAVVSKPSGRFDRVNKDDPSHQSPQRQFNSLTRKELEAEEARIVKDAQIICSTLSSSGSALLLDTLKQ